MEAKQRHRRAAFAGTGALAVLSCALALLAGQPAGETAREGTRPAAVRTIGGVLDTAATVTESVNVSRSNLAAVAVVQRREVARAEAQARIHATWLILRAWLADGMSTPVPTWNELDAAQLTPVAFVPPMTLAGAGKFWEGAGESAPLPVERRHAIEHCLLAPPC